MSKVILIDPPYGAKHSRPQLGTMILAAMLRLKGVDSMILDFTVDERAEEKLRAALREDDVVCVGISSVIGTMLAGGVKVAGMVREERPEIPVVWGGVHPTTEPESTLAHPMVDAICIGEGEYAFPELVDAYIRGVEPAHVKGIAYKRDGAPVYTEPRTELFDLDATPPMPFDLIDLSLYEASKARTGFFGLEGDQMMSLETSRGCAFRCTYCVNAARREPFRKKSAAKVLEELEAIVNQGIYSITINDDNFFVDKKRAKAVLEGVAAHEDWNLEFFVAVRSDYLAQCSEEDYALMKKAGIRMLGIGVESGSDRTLEMINKKESIESTMKASEKLARHGIYAWFHFIYGFPGERKEDFLKTCKVMRDIVQSNPYAQVNLNRLIPNPGTPSFKECVESGWEPPHTLEEWSDILMYTRSKRPEYIDPDLERCWAVNLDGKPFPSAEMPEVVCP